VDHPLAEAGDGEDLFDHEAAGEDPGDHGAEVRDDWEDGVAQAVDNGDAPIGEAFGKCGADVILLKDFDHIGAGETG